MERLNKLLIYLNWAIIAYLSFLVLLAFVGSSWTGKRMERPFFIAMLALITGLIICQFLPYEWNRYVGLSLLVLTLLSMLV